VTALDDQGHQDQAVIYFTGSAEPAPAETAALVTELQSTNPLNPAYFIDLPLRSQWPVYYQCDGQADNTFGEIPSILQEARPIATKRQSDPAQTAGLSFRINPRLDPQAVVDVFLLLTRQPHVPSWVLKAGFSDTGVIGQWRGNDLKRVPYLIFKRTAKPGASIALEGGSLDFLVALAQRRGEKAPSPHLVKKGKP
jgi:hypothetical protein